MTAAREIGAKLRRNKKTVAVAESCTGGMLGAVLTAVSGSSDYFRGGIIAYADAVKRRSLGVSARLLREHGAVSGPVAGAMAQGVRRRIGTDFGIGITGVAGPGGGTPEKPVGLVYIAVAGPRGVRAKAFRFEGGRQGVRGQSCRAALRMLNAALTQKA